MPSINICNDAKPNIPIINGARPNENLLQKIIFKKKYNTEINKHIKLDIKPNIIITLTGILECLIIPKIAKSYKL